MIQALIVWTNDPLFRPSQEEALNAVLQGGAGAEDEEEESFTFAGEVEAGGASAGAGARRGSSFVENIGIFWGVLIEDLGLAPCEGFFDLPTAGPNQQWKITQCRGP